MMCKRGRRRRCQRRSLRDMCGRWSFRATTLCLMGRKDTMPATMHWARRCMCLMGRQRTRMHPEQCQWRPYRSACRGRPGGGGWSGMCTSCMQNPHSRAGRGEWSCTCGATCSRRVLAKPVKLSLMHLSPRIAHNPTPPTAACACRLSLSTLQLQRQCCWKKHRARWGTTQRDSGCRQRPMMRWHSGSRCREGRGCR